MDLLVIVLLFALGLALLGAVFLHLERSHHEAFACCPKGRTSWTRCASCNGGLCPRHVRPNPRGGGAICDRCAPVA